MFSQAIKGPVSQLLFAYLRLDQPRINILTSDFANVGPLYQTNRKWI